MGAPPPTGVKPPVGPPPGPSPGGGGGPDPAASVAEHDDEQDEDDEARQMAALMGFGSFDSTQGKSVDDPRCKMEAVKKKEPRKYRQYMNRRGGFNRPLDEV